MGERNVEKILLANKDKSFVKRVLHRDAFPFLDMGDGMKATHLMSWGEADGKYVVFPTILYDGKGLNMMSPQDAFPKAMESGNFIEFDNPDDAEWFSKNYKQYWEK